MLSTIDYFKFMDLNHPYNLLVSYKTTQFSNSSSYIKIANLLRWQNFEV